MTTNTGTIMNTGTTPAATTGERADLLQAMAVHRYFLRHTVRGITDDQARLRTTVSRLCLGGLIKHVTHGEENWMRFVVEGTAALEGTPEGGAADHAHSFEMLPDETLAGLLQRYEDVARATEAIVTGLPDLDLSHPLPAAPWFEPGASWSARRVLLHLIAETSQHAGHADIIRESLDGATTMA